MGQTPTRVLRPKVNNVADNAIVQVRCVPGDDEINVPEIISLVLRQFEFTLGMSFDIQYLDMDGNILYASHRFMVTYVKEGIETLNLDNFSTLTKPKWDRRCAEIQPLMIFHEDGNKLFGNASEEMKAALENLSPAKLQKHMKALTGKGFAPGTDKDEMVEGIKNARRRLAEIEE